MPSIYRRQMSFGATGGNVGQQGTNSGNVAVGHQQNGKRELGGVLQLVKTIIISKFFTSYLTAIPAHMKRLRSVLTFMINLLFLLS